MDEYTIKQYMDDWIAHACMMAGNSVLKRGKFFFNEKDGTYHTTAYALIDGVIRYHFEYIWTIDKSEDVETLQYTEMQKCFNRVDIIVGKRLNTDFWTNKKESDILVKHFNLFLQDEDYGAIDSFGKLNQQWLPWYENNSGITYHFWLEINKLNKSTNALYMLLGVIIDKFLGNEIFNYYLLLEEPKRIDL